MRIACIGEVMIELIAGQGSTTELGVAGDTYNTAIYLRRALKGIDAAVSYITVLGRDAFSDRIVAHAAAHGLDTSRIARHPTRMPGLYAIETDDAGERRFAYWRSASAARTLFDADRPAPETVFDGYDLVFLSGITLAILPPEARARLVRGIDLYRAGGGRVAFDSNVRPRLWETVETAQAAIADLWRRTDIALPSMDDEAGLFKDPDEARLVARFSSYGVPNGALKRGHAGPLDLGPEGAVLPVVPVATAVDTTAAGDSFNGAYLATWMQGGASLAAMRAGHEMAAHVIQQKGAIVSER